MRAGTPRRAAAPSMLASRPPFCHAAAHPLSPNRSIDISNAAVCMLRAHSRGINLAALNLTSHLAQPGVRYRAPRSNHNDGLVHHNFDQ